MRLNSCVFFWYVLFCHTINGIIALNGINYFILGWEECKRSTNVTQTHMLSHLYVSYHMHSIRLTNKWIRMTLYVRWMAGLRAVAGLCRSAKVSSECALCLRSKCHRKGHFWINNQFLLHHSKWDAETKNRHIL